MVHRGEIVEKVVRRGGYSLTKLAEKLRISRDILYNKFKDANLNYHFIIKVRNIIHYDFSLEIPELAKHTELTDENAIFNLVNEDSARELYSMQAKYVSMLEKYTKLPKIVVKLPNHNAAHALP